MEREEFKRKSREIEEEIKTIFWELKVTDAYIYHKPEFVDFYDQIQRQIEDIDYELHYYAELHPNSAVGFATPEEFYDSLYQRFSRYLRLDANMWKELKTIRFVAPK